MGKGTDLAKEIIEMTREYNRCIRGLRNEVYALREDVDYLRKRKEKYEKILETVTDIICKYMEHIPERGVVIGPIYDIGSSDLKDLCNALEIPLSANEVKE